MSEYKYPLPLPDHESQGFWDATRKHELRIQRCTDCRTFRHPPRHHCPNCHSENSEWAKVSGQGKVYGWCEIYQPVLPAFAASVPYNVVEVALEDAPGVVLTGNMPDSGADEVHVGMAVEVTFDDVDDQITIPRWRKR